MTKEYELPDGTRVREGVGFRITKVGSFPRNWLANATADEIADLGIVVHEIVEPLKSLETVKVDARARVNVWRDRTEESGFDYGGKSYQSDTRSYFRIQGAVTLARAVEAQAPGSFSQTWTASDNTETTLDAAGIEGLFAALATHVGTTFAAAKAHKAAIEVAADADAVQAVIDGLVWP